VIYFAWFILSLAGIQFLVSLVNLLSRNHLPGASISNFPLVSVLIPARNEEKNISNILSDLITISYKHLEIIVYDDESTDSTGEIVKKFETQNRQIRLLPGTPLPVGYTGKNYACHQLAGHASGAYYLFLDADVSLKGAVIEESLSWLIKKDLTLLSIFPVQDMISTGEKISVPLMNWILLSLLPLPLIRNSKRSSLAAANGQFMLFPSERYRKYQFHHRFRNHKVEDVAIARFLKKKGEKVDTLLGKEDLRCRMYDSLGSAIDGFSKNFFLFFGNSIAITILYACLISLSPVFIFIFLPAGAWISYILLILLMRINISLASRQALFQNIFYLLPQQVVFLVIIVKAIHHRMIHKLTWKGRNVLDI